MAEIRLVYEGCLNSARRRIVRETSTGYTATYDEEVEGFSLEAEEIRLSIEIAHKCAIARRLRSKTRVTGR